MFAVGHMSIAYLLGKGSGKALHEKINIPLIMVLSILPDIDIIFDLITNTEIHRGPTHSVVVAIIAFIPIFLIYRKKAIPYFLALISHALIGDFLIGGKLKILWPISSQTYGLHELGGPFIDIYSPINMTLEVSLFVIAMLILNRTGDMKTFFKADKSNLLLIIPTTTVLLPSTIGYPFDRPLIFSQPILAVAHIIYLALFAYAILKTLSFYYRVKLKNRTQLKVNQTFCCNLCRLLFTGRFSILLAGYATTSFWLSKPAVSQESMHLEGLLVVTDKETALAKTPKKHTLVCLSNKTRKIA